MIIHRQGIKIINRYTKGKRKIVYIPFFRRVLKIISHIVTVLVRFQKYRFKRPNIKKVFIETVAFCNNNCSFCPASVVTKAKNPHDMMSWDVFEKIVKQLHEIKYAGTLALYCNNEPLFDQRIVDFTKRLRIEFASSKIEICTNGILLNAKLADDLFESGLSRLIVNHYNDNLELSGNLKRFINEMANSRYQGRISIYMRLKTEILSNRGGQTGGIASLSGASHLWCSLPFEQLYLNYNGDVVLCCSDVLWKCVVGNVSNNHINDLWNGLPLTHIREKLLDGNRCDINICSKCDFLGIKHDPAVFFKVLRNVMVNSSGRCN